MSRSITFSDREDRIVRALTGDHAPTVREGSLWDISRAAETAASQVELGIPKLAYAARNITEGIGGETRAAYLRTIAQYVSNPGYLTESAAQLRRIAAAQSQRATQIEYAKMQLIAGVFELLAEFLFAAAMAIYNPFGAMSWLAARIAAMRAFFQTILRWLVNELLTSVAFEVTTEGFIDGVIQDTQIRRHHRAGFSLASLRSALTGGLIAGLTEAGIMPIAHELGHFVSDHVADHVGHVVDVASMFSGAATTEYVASGLISEQQGQGWQVDGFTAISGLVGAVSDLGGHLVGAGLNLGAANLFSSTVDPHDLRASPQVVDPTSTPVPGPTGPTDGPTVTVPPPSVQSDVATPPPPPSTRDATAPPPPPSIGGTIAPPPLPDLPAGTPPATPPRPSPSATAAQQAASPTPTTVAQADVRPPGANTIATSTPPSPAAATGTPPPPTTASTTPPPPTTASTMPPSPGGATGSTAPPPPSTVPAATPSSIRDTPAAPPGPTQVALPPVRTEHPMTVSAATVDPGGAVRFDAPGAGPITSQTASTRIVVFTDASPAATHIAGTLADQGVVTIAPTTVDGTPGWQASVQSLSTGRVESFVGPARDDVMQQAAQARSRDISDLTAAVRSKVGAWAQGAAVTPDDVLSTLGRLRDAGHHLQPNLERRADLIAATIAGRGEPPRLPGGSHPDDGSSPPEPSTTYDEEIALALAYMFPSPETRAEDSPIVVTEPEASTSATAGRTQRPGLIRAVSTEPAQPRTQATSAEPSPVEVRPMLADEGAATTVRRLTDPTEQRSSDEVIAVPGAASASPQQHSSGSEIILPVHETGSEADHFSASNLFLGGLGRLFDSRRGSLSTPDSPLASTQGAVEDPDPLRSSIGRRAGRRLRSDTVGSSQAWSLPSASPESPHTVPDPPVDDTPEAIRRRKGKGRAPAETQVPLTPTAPSDDERFDRDTALAVNLSRAEQVEQRPGGPSGADRSMPAGSFPPPAPPAPPVPAASATASSLRRRSSVQIITPVPPRSEASTSEAPTLRRGRTLLPRRGSASRTFDVAAAEAELLANIAETDRTALQDAHARALERAEETQAVLDRVISDLPNRSIRLVGQANRVKPFTSLARKFYDSSRAEGIGVADWLNQNKDTVRFSIQVSSERYGSAVRAVLDRMKHYGYTQEKIVNFWRPGNRWYGLTVTMRDRYDRLLELEFPTEKSWQVSLLAKPNHEVVRLKSTVPMSKRVDSYLELLRLNRDNELHLNLPQELRLLPPSREKSILNLVEQRQGEWHEYLADLEREGRTFADVVHGHGLALDDIVERERLGLGPQHLQPSTEQQTAVADEARDVPGALPFLIGKRRGERTASKQREPSLRRSLIAGTLSRASSRRRSSISQTITPESEFVGTVDPEHRRQLAAAVETARSRANATLQELRQVVTDINAAGERATLIDEIHRLKTLDSLIRKFAADYQARAEDPPEFLARNPDLVRFTVQVAPEYYGQTVRDVLDRLAELGYQHDDADVRNYWRPGNRWYGLGTVVRDQGGREVELQFPTASSREIGKRTHPLYDIVRHPDTPLPRRIDAFLNIIRINKDAGLETNLPQGLDLLPTPQANGLIAFIRPIPDAWADYLNDPRGHAWRFAEALAHHGLSISDVPGLPGLEPHYGQEQIRISGDAHRAGDAGGAHRDASLARPTPGGDLAGSEADLALRSDGGSPDDLQRSVGGEPPAHRPAHGRADRPGSTALRTSTGDAVASDLPRRGHPEAPLEDRPPAHPWADPLLTEARPPRPAEARLEPEDRALLLGDGNHLLAALLYTDLDRIEPAFRWTDQARVELGRLRAEREAGRRAVSTTAISHAVAELRTQLVGRIQRLTRDDLNALVSLRSPELVAVPQGDHTALRAALGRLLDPDAEHGNSVVAPHLLAALFGRSVVIDDGERATLLARAGAIGDPIRLYRRAQTGSGRTEYHAFLARRPPQPQPVPPVAVAAPPRPPADPAVLNHPVPTVQFRLGRSSVLEPHDYFGIDQPTNNLDLIARTTARRVRAMAVGRPPEAAPIIVTIEGDGGRWRLPWRSATRLGLRRAKWLARDLEDRVRRILDRDPANAPMVIFRHQAMTTSGVGGPGPRRTATVWVDIADSWDQGRNFVNDAPGRAPAPQRMSDGRLEQIAYAAGVPAHTLPDLANLVNRLLRLAADHGVRESAEPWDQLAGFLVNNYRHLVGDGMVVFLGHIEVHVRLELTDGQSVARPAVPAPERPEKGRDRLAHAADPKAKTRTTETIHGTFQVGAHSESHAGPTSWLRLGGSHGFTFGVPGRLLQIRLSAAIRFVRNLINRSTGTVRDAEVGRVEDTREDAAHVSARARYHLTVRTDRTQTWDNLPTEVLAAKERMLLALPENYLRRPQPGEAAALAAATRPNQPIPVGANRRLPKVFYASGLTSLHLLADDIIRQLERQRGPIELGHPLRAAVWHRVSNLDTHLDKAVNRYRGYEFTLAENGRIIANVRIRTRRVRARGADPEPIPGAPPPVHRADDLSGRPVSAPSRFAHIEEVRTAISGTSAGTTVTNEGSVEPSLEFVLAKLPKLRFGLKIPYARWTWTNRDSNNSGRTGLWVLVSRYAGHTSAYEMDFEHQATVQTRRRRNVLVRARAALGRPRPATRHGHPGNDYTPTAVRGRAMIRVPTADAVAYGIEPPPPPDVRPPEVEPTTFDPSTIPAVPHHVRSGRGVGMGIVEVDPELVDKLVHRIEQELDRYGYVVHDPDKLFAPSKGRSRKHSSQVNNGTALRKFLSTAALESNYDGAHQGGFHITLRKRHTGWLTNFGMRSARVTIRARQPRDVDDMRVNANPRLTKERHIVNLEMGLDNAGSSAGGGQGWATGVRLRFLPQKGGKQLQNAAIGVEYDRSISADESVNHVSNMPRLMEYQGALTEFDVTSEWLVGIDHDRQWALWRLLNRLFHPGALAHRAPIPIPAIRSTAKVRVVPGLNTKASHAPGVAPRATRNTPRAVFDHAAVSYLDTTGLLDTARTTIGAMGQPGGAADEEISTFLNQAQILSHFREVVDGRYTTDTFFQPEFIRDKYRAVSLKADVGPAQFVGATDDPYILGLIKLSLTQTGQSSSRGSGIGGSPLDLAGGGDPGHSDVTNVSGSGTHTMRSGKSTTRGTKDTGGRESLEIAVTEGLAFRAPVSYALRIGKTKRAKLFANTDFVPVERRIGATDVEQMIFILSEPEALEHYASGDVPLDDEYLLKLLARWSSGELKISHRLMARVLMRWERDATATMVNPHRQLRADAVRDFVRDYSWADLEIPAEVRTEFDGLFGVHLARDEGHNRTLNIPPYMRSGPGASLGHSGIHSLRLDGDRHLSDLVAEGVNALAPGLIGKTHDHLMDGPLVRHWYTPWRRRPRVTPYIGRLQGGIDFLQAVLDGGRDQPLLEQMLSEEGITFSFVNPTHWFGQNTVEATIKAVMEEPAYGDYVQGGGLETYRHRYVERRQATQRSFTRGNAFALKGTFDHRASPVPNTFVDAQGLAAPSHHGNPGLQQSATFGPGLTFADGISRTQTTTEQFTYESTVYDFLNHYRAEAGMRFIVETRVVKQGGRRIANFLDRVVSFLLRPPARDPARTEFPPGTVNTIRWWRARADAFLTRPQRRAWSTTADGRVVLKVPRSVAEAKPAPAPTGLRGRLDPTKIPDDAFVSAVQLRGAEQASRRLLGAIFERPVKWNRWWPSRWMTRRGYHTSVSVRAVATRDVLAANLLPAAATPGGVQIATGAFLPGHSSRRADFRLNGRLEDLTIVSELPKTGTGWYVKYQQGVSAATTHDTPYATLGFNGGGPLRFSVTDGNNANEPYGGHRTEGDAGLTVQAPRSHTSTYSDAHRREEHGKQQGDSVLVRLRGRYWLDAQKRVVHWWRPTSWGRRRTSDEFSGDVYVVMFKPDYEALVESRRRSEFNRTPIVGQAGSPAVDMVETLHQFTRHRPAGGATQTQETLINTLAGRRRVNENNALVLEVNHPLLAHHLRENLDEWARNHGLSDAEITAVHDGHAADPAGPDVVALMTEEVNNLHPTATRIEPPPIVQLALDPLRTAQRLARERHVWVDLRINNAEGARTSRYSIAPDQWYIELDPTLAAATPIGPEAAVDALAPGLIDQVVRLGIGRDTLVDLARRPRDRPFATAVEELIRGRSREPVEAPRPLTDAQTAALTNRRLVALDHEPGDHSWLQALITTAQNRTDPSEQVQRIASSTVDELRSMIARRRGMPADAAPPPRSAIAAVLGVEIHTIAADGTAAVNGSAATPLVVVDVGDERYRPTRQLPAPIETRVVPTRRGSIRFSIPRRDSSTTTPAVARTAPPASRPLTVVSPSPSTSQTSAVVSPAPSTSRPPTAVSAPPPAGRTSDAGTIAVSRAPIDSAPAGGTSAQTRPTTSAPPPAGQTPSASPPSRSSGSPAPWPARPPDWAPGRRPPLRKPADVRGETTPPQPPATSPVPAPPAATPAPPPPPASSRIPPASSPTPPTPSPVPPAPSPAPPGANLATTSSQGPPLPSTQPWAQYLTPVESAGPPRSATSVTPQPGAVTPQPGPHTSNQGALGDPLRRAANRLRAYIHGHANPVGRLAALQLILDGIDASVVGERMGAQRIIEGRLRDYERNDQGLSVQRSTDQAEESDAEDDAYEQELEPVTTTTAPLRSDWWYVHGQPNQHQRHAPGGQYVPSHAQQNWLVANGRQVGWVEADGNCAFGAALYTVTPALTTRAARLVAQHLGLPDPGYIGDALSLRRFVADVVDQAHVNPAVSDRFEFGTYAVHPANHDVVRDNLHLVTVEQMVADLRTDGEYGGDAAFFYTRLLSDIFRWASEISESTGGDFRVELFNVPADPAGLASSDWSRFTHAIVHVLEHYLPTRIRPE